ncbi:cytochrome b [Pleionea mediterranea]|uniref:Cytochrome b561 n=1 Tax=Pleionea mediterranea TaxID=523701 RepID=A0A316FXI1_9GAMM|nr:cytochrome b [Pleionea mediterranea]PWK53298.1 cytochrome b561 [Pleionea mediterranea]
MSLKNTAAAYGPIAKWFHWSTAVLFLASYCAIYYREWFAESEFENWISIQLHLSIGITLAVLVTLRIIWRLLNCSPERQSAVRLQQIAVQTGHYALYAIMFIMPISGYLSIASYLSSGGGRITYFLLFDITHFPDFHLFNFFGVSLEALEDPAELIHSYLGAWVVWLLILGHVLAALYHHFIKRDKTIHKMTSLNS